MDYISIRDEAKALMKGFKGHIYGFFFIFLAIQIAISAVIVMVLPDDVIITNILGLILQSVLYLGLFGLIQGVIRVRKKLTYKFVLPSFNQIISYIGIALINGAITTLILIVGILPMLVICALLSRISMILVIILITIGCVILAATTIFIYLQQMIGVCKVVEGDTFKDAFFNSWKDLFGNAKYFMRVGMIMFPISLMAYGVLAGAIILIPLTIFFMGGAGVEGSVIFIGALILIFVLTMCVLGVVLLPKILSVIYLSCSKLREIENDKYNAKSFY
ncbi:MAG: hypothetical protein ACRCWM_12785 [Sarcina sp.]